MSRIRSIKPEFQNSESMGRVSRDARLTFILLWPQADDAGRLRANPRMLASVLFPFDEDAPNLLPGWLDELEKEQCIVRYTVNDTNYVQIMNWNHQKIDRPTPSVLPPPPAKHPKKSKASIREHSPNDRRTIDEPATIIRIRKGRDQDHGREGNGREGKGGEFCTEPPAASVPVVVPFVTIPTNIPGIEVPISEAEIADYERTFPAVDVRQQLRELRRWSIDNPTRRKTAAGMHRFVNLWLAKEQDRGTPQHNTPSRQRTATDNMLRGTLEAIRNVEQQRH